MKRVAIALVFSVLPASALALELDIPIDCQIGKTCFIQNYVDADGSSGYSDYHCGALSYDQHKGTDFRIPSLEKMRDGVNVLAAAAGTIRGGRDTMPDVNIRKAGEASVSNRECGNGVAITHEDGYETQYCHMKKGSITVKVGQKVNAGDVLGQVGLSGLTEFPHLHLQVSKDGVLLDPFTGASMGGGCKATQRPMWSLRAQAQLAYIPTGVLNAGFTTIAPSSENMSDGIVDNTPLIKTSPAMIFWAQLFGIQKGDQLTLRLLSPSKQVLAEKTQTFDRSKAQYFFLIGKKRNEMDWSAGDYSGELTILRAGKPALREIRTQTIAP